VGGVRMRERCVLITGAAKRVGAKVARRLAQQGWHVLLHYHQSRDAALALRDEILVEGGLADVLAADLDDANAAVRLVESAFELTPRLCALVHNASLFQPDHLRTLSSESLQSHYTTNVVAPVLMTQAFAAQYQGAELGCVVNILDARLYAPNPDYVSYTLSKAALAEFTRISAMALAGRVRVVGLAPSVMMLSGGQSEANFNATAGLNLNKAPVTPDDAAAATAFLLETPALNGIILTLDGGQSLLAPARDVAYLTPTQTEMYAHVLPPQHDRPL
jgi:NAD(P)-dependent dehydrogenase (short-subunit alcohol dehydrogenase family)